MVKNAREQRNGDPILVKPRVLDSVLTRNAVRITDEPLLLPLPGEDCQGQLVLEKENGVVKGFRFKCSCGRENYFVIE